MSRLRRAALVALCVATTVVLGTQCGPSADQIEREWRQQQKSCCCVKGRVAFPCVGGQTIREDEPGWDCRTMGNKSCEVGG